jgi:soluble lytic murein transglycosylase-like protein
MTGISSAGVSPGEQAVAERVQQVQALIEAATRVASGDTVPAAGASSSSAQGASSGFASALQTATSAQAAGLAGSTAAESAEVPDSLGVATSPELADQSALGGAGAGAGSGEYESLIDQAAARNGVDPAVLHGLIQQESGFDPSATSSAGASGLTQLMPGTAASLGVANPLNPAESIEGGARYLGQLTAGPGAVERYGGVPPYAETQSYVAKVLGDAETYRESQPSTAIGGGVA